MQEYIPARGGHITRVEVLGGKYLYAINVYTTGESFNLCPADICQSADGAELNRAAACPVDAPKNNIRVEGTIASADVISDVELIMAAAQIEVGGIEFIVDDRDGTAVLLRHQRAVELRGRRPAGDRVRSVPRGSSTTSRPRWLPVRVP